MKMSVGAAERLYLARSRRAFDEPQRRGADGDETPAGRASGIERCCGGARHLTPLGVHLVRARVLSLNGKERAGADVQRHEVARDAARVQRRHQLGREVQPRGRSGHGAIVRGVDRLVVAAVGILRRAPAGDVRRQRHAPDAGDGGVEIGAGEIEGKRHLAVLAARRDGRVERAREAHALVVAEVQAVALLETLGRPRQRAPAALIEPLDAE